MQLCLGVIYAWSVFRGPLGQLYGWPKTATIAPYRYSMLFFTIGMIVGGLWQDRKGPRIVASVGGLMLAAGCLLSAFIGHTIEGLILSYGVVAGLGVGFAYVTPIATCVKWFPDRRGQIAGFAVMGFGAGPLIFAPLVERLLGSDPARYAETIPRTFMIVAGIFAVCVIGAAQFYKVPPAGWRPAGWNPPAASGAARKEEYGPIEILKTPQFWLLWAIYFLGTSVGITAIGEATPIVQELAKVGAAMTAGAALGMMSIFNGFGRLFWGSVSDRAGRNAATVMMFSLHLIGCLLVLRGATGFWQVVLGLCIVGFAYGGFLSLMPSFTADYFGPRHLGANYGLLFTAWGLCGFFVPGYFASIIEASRQAGSTASGYNEMYLTLAGLAAVGLVGALVVRRPK
jgi:OFA family oxalate/formate antiporter-like MFS transporter